VFRTLDLSVTNRLGQEAKTRKDAFQIWSGGSCPTATFAGIATKSRVTRLWPTNMVPADRRGSFRGDRSQGAYD
jgi:hypothetical protein